MKRSQGQQFVAGGHEQTADVLPPIKIGDLFVLNSCKNKLDIKMLGFSNEID